ncbi:MAG: carbohydrate kinase family protein, partial [Burkholderiales bacterium]|nr:carbohydrate kinase family protein [Burkholderiales bacterium]
LKLLGGEPLIMATIGDDSAPYMLRLKQLALDAAHVRHVPDTFTAQAFITTDLDDNQITAFHPGAMNYSHENSVTDAQGITLGIVAPDGRDGMLEHARQFHEAGIPFVFDPGQGLPMFNGEELRRFVELADYVALNDYEAQLIQDRTGKTLAELSKRVKALIVTLGANGSAIYIDGKPIDIAPVKAKLVVDPTGCGDAYRSGLLYGIVNDFDWPTTGKLASVMGALKIAQRGAQNHGLPSGELSHQLQAEFGITL